MTPLAVAGFAEKVTSQVTKNLLIIFTHATKTSTEQTSMRTTWFKYISKCREGAGGSCGGVPNFAVGLTQWSPPSKPIVRISRSRKIERRSRKIEEDRGKSRKDGVKWRTIEEDRGRSRKIEENRGKIEERSRKIEETPPPTPSVKFAKGGMREIGTIGVLTGKPCTFWVQNGSFSAFWHYKK